MNTIVIGFSRPKKFKLFAWTIMKVLKTSYDHVYVRFHSDSIDRDLIYQASKMMVNFVGLEVFNDENIIVEEFEVEIDSLKRVALMQFMVDNAGKPYSFKEIIGFVIKMVFKLKDNPLGQKTKEYVCSVIASYIIENFTDKKINEDFQDMTPKDLYEYLKYGKT